MKEFEPSPDFVDRVMAAVRAETDSAVTPDVPPVSRWITSTPLRWSLVLGGAVVTLINLLRMLASVFAPVLCR